MNPQMASVLPFGLKVIVFGCPRSRLPTYLRERSVITKHLRNIFKDGELVEESNVQNLNIAGSDKPVKFYNLDAIISVSYRVNSKRGTQFRQWATGVLREHLIQGWTLDRARFEHNANELEAALALVRKATQSSTIFCH